MHVPVCATQVDVVPVVELVVLLRLLTHNSHSFQTIAMYFNFPVNSVSRQKTSQDFVHIFRIHLLKV